MENASKALLIAGGILISIIVISVFILGMRGIAAFQESRSNAEVEQQTVEFNNLYESYNRSNIRGNDIISLMNRIVDYNNRQKANGYTEMQVSFHIPDDIRKKLCYDEDVGNLLIERPDYDQTKIGEIVGTPTSISGDISGGKIRDLEEYYGQKYCNQLASEISNIQELAEKGATSDEVDEYFATNYKFPKPAHEYGTIDDIYEDAMLYYEYVQFKRTYFKCTGTDYDPNTGRLIKMEFECTGIGV